MKHLTPFFWFDYPGAYTIAGHSIWQPPFLPNMEGMIAPILAAKIQEFTNGSKEPVLLVGCETAKGGEQSLAATVAKCIGRSVGGYTECIWPSGGYIIQGKDDNKDKKKDPGTSGKLQWYGKDGKARSGP